MNYINNNNCIPSYKITNLGNLKYDRIKSMHIIRTKLSVSITESKFILDSIINKLIDTVDDYRLIECLNIIFDNIKLEKIPNEFDNFVERNFPINFIPPIG